ncbi:MAG: hypothetical protein ACPLRX_09475 [Candidatus Saccharicenans sp.]
MPESMSQQLGLIPQLEGQKAGLPFWLFYFLLSIILLLLFINFLQNKNLRQKISFFLSGPRRRFNRLRLEIRRQQETEKKEELIRELGKLASVKNLKFPEVEELMSEIRALEEQSYQLQGLWHEVYRKLEFLKLEKRKALSEPQSGQTPDLNQLQENIARLENEKKLLEDKIMTINEQLAHYHLSLGRVVNRVRPDYEDLAFLYFQIDKIEKLITNLEKELDNF